MSEHVTPVERFWQDPGGPPSPHWRRLARTCCARRSTKTSAASRHIATAATSPSRTVLAMWNSISE
jgi:hypothetical protein